MTKAKYEWVEYALISDTDTETPCVEENLGVSLHGVIHDILYDSMTPNKYTQIYDLYKKKVVSKNEFTRVRRNAWRAHKRKLAKNNYRIARVRTTEVEL